MLWEPDHRVIPLFTRFSKPKNNWRLETKMQDYWCGSWKKSARALSSASCSNCHSPAGHGVVGMFPVGLWLIWRAVRRLRLPSWLFSWLLDPFVSSACHKVSWARSTGPSAPGYGTIQLHRILVFGMKVTLPTWRHGPRIGNAFYTLGAFYAHSLSRKDISPMSTKTQKPFVAILSHAQNAQLRRCGFHLHNTVARMTVN